MTASTQKIKKRKSSSEEHSVPEKKARLSIEAKHEFFAIPYPWIRVNGTLNNRVLDKLLGVVLLQCVSNPGISLFDLGKILKFFYPVHLRHLLEVCNVNESVYVNFIIIFKRFCRYSKNNLVFNCCLSQKEKLVYSPNLIQLQLVSTFISQSFESELIYNEF